METKLVIFDFDGVILDTFELTKHIYRVFGHDYGLEMLNKNMDNPEFFKDFFELDWTKTLEKLGITNEEDIDKIDKHFVRLCHEYSHMVKIYEGMDIILKDLQKRYTLAVVSNNYKEVISSNLKSFHLLEHFSLILGGADGKIKPDPDLLIKCMKHFKCSPKETVFIGDMDGDIIAGKAAKIKKVVAVSYGYHSLNRLKNADCIISSPKEITEAVR